MNPSLNTQKYPMEDRGAGSTKEGKGGSSDLLLSASSMNTMPGGNIFDTRDQFSGRDGGGRGRTVLGGTENYFSDGGSLV